MHLNTNLCLNYHDFSGTKSNDFANTIYTVKLSKFIQLLKVLEQYNNIGHNELLTPDKLKSFTYSLTFDDGRKLNLYIAEVLASELNSIAKNPDKIAVKSQKGLKQSRGFLWQQAVENVYKIIEDDFQNINNQ